MDILLKHEVIEATVGRLAKDIMVDYHKKDLLILIVLKGAFIFGADLIRHIDKANLTVGFVKASSYKGELIHVSSVVFDKLPLIDVHDKHVLVVEDIVDTGHTCVDLRDGLLIGGPTTLRFCTLLDKPSRREVEFEPNYVGFKIPNKFVIGYGLDFGEKYRNLKDIYTFGEDK